MVDIEIRPMLPDERPYVLDTFLKSYGKTRYGNGIHPDVLIGLMETLLVYWECLVAVKDGVILGWLVHEPNVVGVPRLAWGYVRHAFRSKGIFRALMDNAWLSKSILIECAFEPDRKVKRQLSRHQFEFNPYLPLDVARRAQDQIIAPSPNP